MNDKAICVCSSGMDSTTTAIKMREDGYDIHLLHFNYGQRAEKREEEAIRKIARYLAAPLTIWNIRELGKLSSALTDRSIELPKGFKSAFGLGCWHPSRNVVFLGCASALCESLGGGVITLGGESSESHYKDNTVEFANRFSSMLELGCLLPVKVSMPLAGMTKVEELKWAYEKGYGEVFDLTWSCDEGYERPCGQCGCDCSRRFAFMKAGFVDNQEYLDDEYFYKVFLPEYEKRKGEIKFRYE